MHVESLGCLDVSSRRKLPTDAGNMGVKLETGAAIWICCGTTRLAAGAASTVSIFTPAFDMRLKISLRKPHSELPLGLQAGLCVSTHARDVIIRCLRKR